MNGSGIDGVTNSFAAGLWWIEFIMEAAIIGLYEISIDGTMRDNYYQSIWKLDQGKYEPTVFYYASMLANLAGSEGTFIIPSLTGGISHKIKTWAFESAFLMKILILNKDMNSSLSGKVLINVES